MREQIEEERSKNLWLEANQREADFKNEKLVTQLRFKISQLLRYIGPDLLPKVEENEFGNENGNSNEEFQGYHVEEG